MKTETAVLLGGSVVLVGGGGLLMLMRSARQQQVVLARQTIDRQRQADLVASAAIAKRQQESQGNIFGNIASGISGLFAGFGALAANKSVTGGIGNAVGNFFGGGGGSANGGAGATPAPDGSGMTAPVPIDVTSTVD